MSDTPTPLSHLIDALTSLHDALAAITQLTHQEAELLANARVDDLKRTLRIKGELLVRSSVTRDSARRLAAETLGVELTEHARLATLIEEIGRDLELSGDEASIEALTSTWQDIIACLDELERAQQMSERLATQGMEWIEGCLAHLTEPRPQSSGNVYTRNGRAQAAASSFLQRKA